MQLPETTIKRCLEGFEELGHEKQGDLGVSEEHFNLVLRSHVRRAFSRLLQLRQFSMSSLREGCRVLRIACMEMKKTAESLPARFETKEQPTGEAKRQKEKRSSILNSLMTEIRVQISEISKQVSAIEQVLLQKGRSINPDIGDTWSWALSTATLVHRAVVSIQDTMSCLKVQVVMEPRRNDKAADIVEANLLYGVQSSLSALERKLKVQGKNPEKSSRLHKLIKRVKRAKAHVRVSVKKRNLEDNFHESSLSSKEFRTIEQKFCASIFKFAGMSGSFPSHCGALNLTEDAGENFAHLFKEGIQISAHLSLAELYVRGGLDHMKCCLHMCGEVFGVVALESGYPWQIVRAMGPIGASVISAREAVRSHANHRPARIWTVLMEHTEKGKKEIEHRVRGLLYQFNQEDPGSMGDIPERVYDDIVENLRDKAQRLEFEVDSARKKVKDIWGGAEQYKSAAVREQAAKAAVSLVRRWRDTFLTQTNLKVPLSKTNPSLLFQQSLAWADHAIHHEEEMVSQVTVKSKNTYEARKQIKQMMK